jgi:Na+/melibiose symporter-like transporter
VAEGERTGIGVRLAYGFGSVAFGTKDNGFSYLLLFYYDQVLGLPAILAGAALLTALLVDAVSDPIVGYVSDNWRSRFGRRHPFMYASALPVAVSYWFLWNPPTGLSEGELFAWLLCVAILVRTLITVYEIPSTAMVSELTDAYDERTSLLSFRYFFGWWGGLTMAVLFYFVFAPMDGAGRMGAEGYHVYGTVACVVMFVAILVSSAGTHHRIPTLRQAPPGDRPSASRAIAELKETLANPNIRTLFIAALFYGAGAGLAAALNIYLNTYVFEFSDVQVGWFNFAYFGSALVALMLSPLLSRRFGKKRAAIGMSIAAMIIYPSAILLKVAGFLPPSGSDALFQLLIVANAIDVVLLICSTTLISAMVADVVEESELVTGRRSEGVFFAARTLALKAVSGLGLFGATLLLAAISFPADVTAAAEVPRSVIDHLGIAYVLTTTVLYSGAVVFYLRYRISRSAHEDNVRRLATEDAH